MALEFERARRELALAHTRNGNLCDPFVALLPITGAALSVLASNPNLNATLCASDDVSARIDELQFDLGEGPCWDALASRKPVLRPDLASVPDEWPIFSAELSTDERTAGVASVFAFHLAVGSLDIGAVDLYSANPSALDENQVSETRSLADVASWQVLRRVLEGVTDGPAAYSRREVHQATGMLIVQLDVTAEEAGLLLRAHAYATGRSVRELASDVVARRVDFSDDGRTPPSEVVS